MANTVKDVEITDDHPVSLLLDKHANYIASYGNNKDDFEYCMTEYLRMSGMYWGLTAMELMGQSDRMNKDEVITFIKECQCPETGGFSASHGHDPHMLSTLSAIQKFNRSSSSIDGFFSHICIFPQCIQGFSYSEDILCMYDSLSAVDTERITSYVVSLQRSDGSFTGDQWGEVDTRFSFCAVACLSLLNRMDAINIETAVSFVVSCMNFDGGFGSRPGSESHAGLIYCCVGFLSVTGRLHHIDSDLLAWWLCERQLGSGGLNGRPEKLPDVCYSWWVLASLTMLGRLHWIEEKAIERFVLACQDTETGGFSDRPGDLPDPFHTLFGLAALSLLGCSEVKAVNPTYCMPQEVINRLGLTPQRLVL